MRAGDHLRNAAAGRVSPEDHITQPQPADERLDVLHVVFDEIRALRIPSGIAVPAHVDGDDVVVVAEMRREMVERMRHARRGG